MTKTFDVIVIGAGHAGCEAAAAAARIGAKVALITFSQENIGVMSCNPAVGGVAKGIIVKEIDALDGVLGKVADRACVHYKKLNASKGPAVWGPRAQCDRALFKDTMQEIILNYPNLSLVYGEVTDLLINNMQISGVEINADTQLLAHSVVITSGTFLGGVIHIGKKKICAGRVDENPSNKLAARIRSLLETSRMKTGTPPRLTKGSIHWDKLEVQPSDPFEPFSTYTKNFSPSLIDCHITHTNSVTHKIITDNISHSPMFSGQISANGPRYCPSIEDKVTKFSHKERHQIFLEKESYDSDLVYPNGISTSLPEWIQDEIIHSIDGLEEAKIAQYGYAIEYDFIDPRQLKASLECKTIPGLFFAGQINGTTGYEEAAGQGLIAGANAALKLNNDTYIHSRSDSYIGVMISDLTINGTSEPYRMMTARSEHRLSLRSDNAHERLFKSASSHNLLSHKKQLETKEILNARSQLKETLCQISLTPNQYEQYGITLSKDGKRRSLYEALAFIQCDRAILNILIDRDHKTSLSPTELNDHITHLTAESMYSTIKDKYTVGISDQSLELNIKIPENIDYLSIPSLSNELRQKLAKAKPERLSDARLIQGITPAAITALQIQIKRMAQNG